MIHKVPIPDHECDPFVEEIITSHRTKAEIMTAISLCSKTVNLVANKMPLQLKWLKRA